MPTYDYVCSACGHRFEEFQSMSSNPLKKCPSCKKLKLERLIGTGAGVIFKGSGFYETDYRGDSYANDKKKDSESSSSDAKASNAKASDAKASDAKGGSEPTGGTPDATAADSTPKKD